MYWDATKALGQGRVQLKEIESGGKWKEDITIKLRKPTQDLVPAIQPSPFWNDETFPLLRKRTDKAKKHICVQWEEKGGVGVSGALFQALSHPAADNETGSLVS